MKAGSTSRKGISIRCCAGPARLVSSFRRRLCSFLLAGVVGRTRQKSLGLENRPAELAEPEVMKVVDKLGAVHRGFDLDDDHASCNNELTSALGSGRYPIDDDNDGEKRHIQLHRPVWNQDDRLWVNLSEDLSFTALWTFSTTSHPILDGCELLAPLSKTFGLNFGVGMAGSTSILRGADG